MTANWLFLIPAFPLLGALTLGLVGRRIPSRVSGWVGSGSVAASALLSLVICARFVASPPPGGAWQQMLWTWIDVGNFRPEFRLRLDSLSLVMTTVVTFVGFLIHVYSTEFMAGDRNHSRYFAFLNLFVASMLTLVMADDLLLLYLGWEGVGLCSYLLIGFWYENPENGRAARKAFIVTRVGDASLAVGLFVLFTRLGTLDIPELMQRAVAHWPPGAAPAVVASALLLGGAVGKSAQLPLQTWLPDAMAGPTPVSALIHAATMVTAGVYLIARMHPLFDLSPDVRVAVGAVGAVTLLMAAVAALAQRDIKRVLAYSTMSQIGYMFLALGVGAYSAAIFHFMSHAFFKALLFLCAGAVIQALREEHDIFKMGGALRKRIPIVFWGFLVGAASLAALPFVTAGFYSKDLILVDTALARGLPPYVASAFTAAGLLGAFLTAIYSFRLFFLVFLSHRNEERNEARSEALSHAPGAAMHVPIVILAVLAIAAGWIPVPSFVEGLADPAAGGVALESVSWVTIVSGVLSVTGIGLAYLLYARPTKWTERVGVGRTGFGFDRFYDGLFVRPVRFVARMGDPSPLIFTIIEWLVLALNRLLSLSQTGRVRWYAAVMTGGAVVLLALSGVL